MQFLDLILADTEAAVDSVLVRFVGEEEIAELQSDVVESFKGVELFSKGVIGVFMLRVALEEDEDTAILLLKALAEEDLIDIHILLLLTHHSEPHPLRV